jgi:hypothetical protein
LTSPRSKATGARIAIGVVSADAITMGVALLQRLVGRRTCHSSGTPQHDGPEERLSLESIGLVETTGSKIRDLE